MDEGSCCLAFWAGRPTRTLPRSRGTLSPLKAAATLPFSWNGIPTHSRSSRARRKAGAGRLPLPASLLALGRGDGGPGETSYLIPPSIYCKSPFPILQQGWVRKCKYIARPDRKGLAEPYTALQKNLKKPVVNGEEIAEQLNDSIDVAVSGVDHPAESDFFDAGV